MVSKVSSPAETTTLDADVATPATSAVADTMGEK